MRTYLDAKIMAKSLRERLAREGIDISHAQALESVAAQFGFADWNVLAAKVSAAAVSDGIVFDTVAPIHRIFDEAKAREFYVDFLGFRLDWEHRFADGLPLYCQVSRAGMTLHLSGHFGDASPGATTFVFMRGVEAYQRDLSGKRYPNMNPGIEALDWGKQMTVTDPFNNRIRFCESND